MKSKLFMILVVLVMLITVVGLSGCLGGDDKNATNNTTPENNTTVGNNTTENNTTTEDNTTQPPASGGAVTVVLGEAGDAEPNYFIRTNNQKYSTNSLSISKGETIRFMNVESRNFRHLFHSSEGAFEDFNLDPRYSATLTFNQVGTYKIELLNYYSGESYGGTPQVLTVTVT